VPYLIYSPVQTDQTGPSIAAMRRDMAEFLASKGVTPEELTRTIDGSIRELPGQFETAEAVMGGMESNVLYHRPDNYYETLASKYRALTAPELDAAAKTAIDPGKLTWVVIGDASKVKPQLDALGIPVEVVGEKYASPPLEIEGRRLSAAPASRGPSCGPGVLRPCHRCGREAPARRPARASARRRRR
jgi:hypothetical protein